MAMIPTVMVLQTRVTESRRVFGGGEDGTVTSQG